jgi:DNA-directed RNA polymerase subunit M/transcription elongation factor TFIIS
MMTENQRLFRIYTCPGCRNTGYVQVADKQEECRCSLCGALIVENDSALYAENQEQARELVARVSMSSTSEETQVIRGLGKRRRILRMIRALQDLRRNRAVPVQDVIKECEYAGISEETARKFIDVLVEQDLVEQVPEGLVARIGDD